MNREQTAEAIQVMQDWLDGGNLQERELGNMDAVWDSYGDNAQPVFMFDKYEYRIKPMPREFWINARTYDCYANKVAAEANRDRVDFIVHVREVIE